MLVTQKSNLHLNEKLDFLKSENNRLKTLLSEHGIEFSEHVGSKFAAFDFKLPRNSSTSSSPSQQESQSSTGSGDELAHICNNDNSITNVEN